MIGTIATRTRPLRLAYLVDPNTPSQVREAIRLSSSLWGGIVSPIVQLYRRMPATWADQPIKAPSAERVILGFLNAFDPDFLVQLSGDVPGFVMATGRQVISPSSIWQVSGESSRTAPRYGIGIFELLGDVFEKHFRYKAKYPIRVVLPRIPRTMSLFWASVFGDLPISLMSILDAEFRGLLEIEDVDVGPDRLFELMATDILFPRRIVQGRLSSIRRSGIRRDARIFFLDANRVDDIVDFWNLRAFGRDTIAVPKQAQTEPAIKKYVAEFIKSHWVPWPHNPTVFDSATLVRSRNTTMEEMQEFAATLRDDLPVVKPHRPFYSLQRWYPRIWDEWGREKDGAMPDDFYGEEEEYDVGDRLTSKISIKLALPDFAEEMGFYPQGRCCRPQPVRRALGPKRKSCRGRIS
jgi:hypothetical protein